MEEIHFFRKKTNPGSHRRYNKDNTETTNKEKHQDTRRDNQDMDTGNHREKRRNHQNMRRDNQEIWKGDRTEDMVLTDGYLSVRECTKYKYW